MNILYKYEVFGSPDEMVVVKMPKDATILGGVQLDLDNKPVIYASVIPDKLVERKFVNIFTGHSIPKNSVYVGTYRHINLVWHLFEIIK